MLFKIQILIPWVENRNQLSFCSSLLILGTHIVLWECEVLCRRISYLWNTFVWQVRNITIILRDFMELNKTRDGGKANETSISSLLQCRFVLCSLCDGNLDWSCRSVPSWWGFNPFLRLGLGIFLKSQSSSGSVMVRQLMYCSFCFLL